MKTGKIIVYKSGMIGGINRYTEIPFVAEELAEFNMMHPDEAVEKEFDVNTGDYGKTFQASV